MSGITILFCVLVTFTQKRWCLLLHNNWSLRKVELIFYKIGNYFLYAVLETPLKWGCYFFNVTSFYRSNTSQSRYKTVMLQNDPRIVSFSSDSYLQKHTIVILWSYLFSRDFKIQRRGGNENVKKDNYRFNKQNNNFARASRFLYISLPFLHDYDVKMPNLVFYEERKQATTKVYFAF